MAIAGVLYSGAAQERVLSNPGVIVRWGLAPVLALHHLAFAAVVGSLIFTAIILPRNLQPDQRPAFARALSVAPWATAMMALAFAVPWLLVASRPLRLALTVLPVREDGSTGTRESVLWLSSAAATSGPLFSGLMLGSVTILFYLTPSLRLSLAEHVAHENTLILFLGSGLLLANALQHEGEVPELNKRQLGGLAAGLAGIAATGIRFLRPDVIEQEWFTGLGRAWASGPAADQHNAGIILLFACILWPVLITASHHRTRKPGRAPAGRQDL